MIRPPRPPHRRPGFTLIELICSMAIAAMLALALYSSLSIAFKAKQSAYAAVGSARTGAVVLDLIARDLECTLPPTGILAGAFTGTHASGNGADADTDSLDFYCVGEDAAPAQQTTVFAEGIRHVGFKVDSGNLVRDVQRNLLATVAQEPEEQVLCRNVRSFSVRYYDGTNWLDTWDSSANNNILPLAVQIDIVLPSDPNAAGSANPGPSSTHRVSRILLLSTATPGTAVTP